MRVIDQSVELLTFTPGVLELIEDAGRTCYKSESKGDPGGFVMKLVQSGHHSVIEHAVATVRIITNRGVTHELVRHRLASYSQESTRYCNYWDDVCFIRPYKSGEYLLGEYRTKEDFPTVFECAPDILWLEHMLECEKVYSAMLETGWKPEDARGVLPNDLKTEIVVTANMREWRHIFSLRGSKAAHPQIRQVAHMLLEEFHNYWPELFHDIYVKQFPHMEV